MPFCTQCASAVPDGSRFCPACGAPVAPLESAGVSQEPTRTSGSEAPRATPLTPLTPAGPHGRFEPGTRIGTRYRIVALLGRGGMGEVHRADDLELGQSVALKFLPLGIAASPEELMRFRGEVRVARMIAHPNVCRVYDIGEADGLVFLSMEYIDGEDLSSVLRRMGRPTHDKAVEIARQICLGLAAAHDAGMLHRDLKPANVMIDGRGRARITDFGLAGLADELAREGKAAGTPAYMAPEQLAGGRLSVRSDLYALGLVLYELFTGKRVFEAGTMAELRRLQESGSITTPSDLARDIDPAVERVILHCLERDPGARPSSSYAVLAALPGGDPLAAAIAAGETPSPELVANAGARGTLRPAVIATCLAAGLAGILVWAGILGPEYRPLVQPAEVLSVRAADVLARSGSFGALPRYTAEGFDRSAWSEREAKPGRDSGDIYFWRRWSPRRIESPNIHQALVEVGTSLPLAVGEAAVLLDPAGRLVALRAIPPDTIPAARGGAPSWAALWTATGLDSSAFVPAALVRPVPAECDSAAAWAGPVPWRGGEKVTVQMGASRGRLVHLVVLHGGSATTAPLDAAPEEPSGPLAWVFLLLYSVVPLVASVVFGIRNLRLGRGDLRNASRIAVFVLVMNLLQGLFTTRLSEVGLLGLGTDLTGGRTFGHSLIHAVGIWLAYVALEPYVRRLWPTMLVSWTRLVSGRVRDPLVGRDLLIGGAIASALTALEILALPVASKLGVAKSTTQIDTGMLTALTGLSYTSCMLAYAGSICILDAFVALVVVLLLRLVLRSTGVAVAVTFLTTALTFTVAQVPHLGWVAAAANAILGASTILVLMRFGLLAAVASLFVILTMNTVVGTLDLSSWYADRALIPMVLIVGILLFGGFNALGGRPLVAEPNVPRNV